MMTLILIASTYFGIYVGCELVDWGEKSDQPSLEIIGEFYILLNIVFGVFSILVVNSQ